MCKCRYCKEDKVNSFLDLGRAPLSNDYLNNERIQKEQYTLPLNVGVCSNCFLVQIKNYEAPSHIFNEEYKYYSSFSSSWLEHCRSYVDMIVKKLNLNKASAVMEIASNDGYLLQYFKKYGIEPIGIEPSESVAKEARKKNIQTIVSFFSEDFAKNELKEKQDLIIGNNVLAHVPDINNFVSGLKYALKRNGTITLEFPHLLNLMKYNQFDTIYHEHFSYLSLLFLKRIFKENGLKIYDVERLETHGGSLRVYVTHQENDMIPVCENVETILTEEKEYGLDKVETYLQFSKRVKEIKYNTLEKLIEIKRSGKKIVGYGAAAKGNTFFNYAGIGKEFIDYVVDASPYKQGLFLPGSQLPILSPEELKKTMPDYIIIVPWNLKNEIMEQLSYTKEWGCKFITLIPEWQVYE